MSFLIHEILHIREEIYNRANVSLASSNQPLDLNIRKAHIVRDQVDKRPQRQQP